MKNFRTGIIVLACAMTMFPTMAHAAFSDIPPTHFINDYIDGLVEMGIFQGNDDGTFRPDASLSRAEGAALGMRVASLRGATLPVDKMQLADVPANAWYSIDASSAVMAKFMTATPKDGKLMFYPATDMTRADMVRMLVRSAGMTASAAASPVFIDVPATSPYFTEIMAAYEAGIVEGYMNSKGERYFAPSDAVTRAQFGKMAYVALENGGFMPGTDTGSNIEYPMNLDHSDRLGSFMAPFCAHDATEITCSYNIVPFKFLKTYPFTNPDVQLVEGFALYDGNLKDEIGTPHKGVDYILEKDGEVVPFDVYAMSDGYAYQGVSGSWGNYVMTSHTDLVDERQYLVVYSHLDDIPASIPDTEPEDFAGWQALPVIKAGTYLGKSGTTGMTNDIPQLHLEVQQFDTWTWQRLKLDPYGIFHRLSSLQYPQPADSLEDLAHFWMTDEVPLATPLK